VNVAIDQLPLLDMDILLMCSDGLSNKVRSEEMLQMIDRAPSLKEACQDLIRLANQRGGEDNITVLVSQFTGSNILPAALGNATAPLSMGGTVPLAGNVTQPSNEKPSDRWGAATIPRDPSLPYEVNLNELYEEEETLRPTERIEGQS
jgi:protein phosphatase